MQPIVTLLTLSLPPLFSLLAALVPLCIRANKRTQDTPKSLLTVIILLEAQTMSLRNGC